MRFCKRVLLFASLFVALLVSSIGLVAADEPRPGQWYNLAIQGDINAQYLMGVAYYEGAYHFTRDPSKAEDWLQKAHDGGHELALAKLNEIRQARSGMDSESSGDAGLDRPHQQVFEVPPQAIALAETLLQRALLNSSHAREACSGLGIDSGRALLYAPFNIGHDSAERPGDQMAHHALTCFSGPFYGLSAGAYSVIDTDAMKNEGISWDRSQASEACKKPIEAMNADSAGKPLNSLGQVRLHSTGYQIAQYFQDCVIAQVEVLAEILPYWSGNLDPNFNVPREPLSDAEIDEFLGVVKFGNWSYRKPEKEAVVFGGPEVAHLKVACIDGSLHLQISAYPRFKNMTPDFHVASQAIHFYVDGGSKINAFGRLVDNSANATWQFDDDDLLALLRRLQSGSQLRAGVMREPKIGSRGIYSLLNFSLKGSNAAINEVIAACEG